MVPFAQRDDKIIVTDPTTLTAILNSLQMGFKTLSIQKRSSEVWQILGAVKTEFGMIGDVQEKAQKKISEANKELDNLVGTRTRVLLSKLKKYKDYMPPKVLNYWRKQLILRRKQMKQIDI